MPVAVIAALSIGLALAVYLGLERLGRRGAVPAALRTVAGTGLGLLLVDWSCAKPPEATRPLVLLDGSLSMGAAGGRWREARAGATGLGEVRLIGRLGPDSAPLGGRSVVAPAVTAALTAGRPVWLVTDGEIEDRADLSADLLGGVGVRLFPRVREPDLAITRVKAPERIAVGDTLRVEIDVRGFGMDARRQVTVDLSAGEVRWLSRTVPLESGSGSLRLEAPLPAAATPGPHLVTVALRDAADSEPRDDRRLTTITVLPTPGIVVVATPASWESRFFYRSLADVSALPVRGFFAIDPSRWQRMGEVTPAPSGEVEQAVARADVLVFFGDLPARFAKVRPKGRWDWVSTSAAASPGEGDWYLVPGPSSPVAGAFIGLPVDSFPPAVGLAALTPGPGDWIGLSGQLNRRGVERPAVVGRDSAGRREVLVGAAGLWRWAFRGGSSEQAYRAWVAATITWLLGASDSSLGRARPIRAVAEQGRAVVFERLRPEATALRIDLTGPAGSRSDTLRFDGAGRAELSLPPGSYQYRLEGGGSGLLGVETYSGELLPRPVVLVEHGPTVAPPPGRSPLRDRWWIYGLIIVALSGEWWWRRRGGLR